MTSPTPPVGLSDRPLVEIAGGADPVGTGPYAAEDIRRPLATVDVVIFAIVADRLQALLVKRPDSPGEPFRNRWALPGGFVDPEIDATLEGCAQRKLREKTGLEQTFLEQVGAWGGRARDPRGWSVTTLFYALIRADQAPGIPIDGDGTRWFPADRPDRPSELAFDHDKLLDAVLERMRGTVENSDLPAFLLPPRFTMPELQRVFETVLDRKLDHSAFRTRMKNSGSIVATDDFNRESKRPAQRYRLAANRVTLLGQGFRKR